MVEPRFDADAGTPAARRALHEQNRLSWNAALLAAGLRLEHFREYDYCNGFRPFKEMKELGGRRWTVPDGKPGIPFMYSLVARKPGRALAG